jgi:CheY-like chemotaxis protein
MSRACRGGALPLLYLPETGPGEAEEPRPAAGEVVASGIGRRLLVVEDYVEVGRFAMHILQDLGYETTWVVDAAAALARLDSNGPGFDAVFSDVVMPGMNGVEFGWEVRRRWPGLPVMLAFGYSHEIAEDSGHGFELLRKPCSTEQRSRILQRVMAPAGRP